MAGITGAYFGLTKDQLTGLQSAFINCLQEIATVGKSYTVGQRTYTLADMSAVQQQLAEVNAALRRLSGNRVRKVVGNFAFRNPYYS